jgi:hypothetical protein
MKLKVISLVALMTLLTGCAGAVYKTEVEVYCPPIVEYNDEFNVKLLDEIESLPETDGNPAVVEALSDYAALRDKIRACKIERDNLKDK